MIDGLRERARGGAGVRDVRIFECVQSADRVSYCFSI